ncbi:apoptosis-associated speck-like protein containing a CARD isoform X1 [Sinocyclocheilus rhinocerous]|uniref:apoptosis-associated speck-like protein containing a CARD isoform X1 n=1 Tax=Sinocyclocheilus rhinocerous TaxID=307959 RepID=UPI0007B8EC9A|nr:PREDICTED: apoptosis-associated speck-like protein containing a CARD isoform X1 [Sinocyclocheilus rhinocerous]XP_016404466.1 PREDICTED: apoptosis-associated speck-like protein containing a CARD isoform X1 [Sinocyclocheilus rhinocerous]
MAVHQILLDCLDELVSEELDIFKWHLTQGIHDFKIPKSQLEKKSRCDIVECMIQRYSPDGAGKLTLLVLEKMNQMNNAKELREKLGHMDTLQSKHTAEAGAAQKQERCKLGAEFVDKHRTVLIQQVSLVEPIADDMKPLIGDEKYRIVLNSGTSPAQMRALLNFLSTTKLKEKLYQSLKIHEQFLVDDLECSE